MNYHIQKMKESIVIVDDQTNKQKILNGYAFMGEHGHCMIIAWGESRRDFIKRSVKPTNL